MEPTQQIANTSAQDLQTFMTIVKWAIGLMAPIVSGLALAVWKLWSQNNTERKRYEEEKTKASERHEEKLEELWKTTLDVLVEQGKVVERLTAKIGEHNDAG